MKKGSFTKWVILGIVVMTVVIAVSMRVSIFEAIEILKTPVESNLLTPKEYLELEYSIRQESIEMGESLESTFKSNTTNPAEILKSVLDSCKAREFYIKELENIKPPEGFEKYHELNLKFAKFDLLAKKALLGAKTKESYSYGLQGAIVFREFLIEAKRVYIENSLFQEYGIGLDDNIESTYSEEEKWRSLLAGLE